MGWATDWATGGEVGLGQPVLGQLKAVIGPHVLPKLELACQCLITMRPTFRAWADLGACSV